MVTYFEIPVRDILRAKTFYETVFNTSLDLVTVDGHEMAMFPEDPEGIGTTGGIGATGALASGDSYVPGPAGVRVYFTVADIDQTLEKALELGGALSYPVTEVAGYGWVAEFSDLEGNIIALHSKTRENPR